MGLKWSKSNQICVDHILHNIRAQIKSHFLNYKIHGTYFIEVREKQISYSFKTNDHTANILM